MKYWLFKSEPETFGIDDLAKSPRRTTAWEGVRNYQARNMMRDEMRRGDLGFFYHSSCDVPGIQGVVEVVREAHPDASAFDPDSPYHDPASDPANPRWQLVDVRLVRRFARPVTLEELKRHADGKLKDMIVLRRGNRLSITPVTPTEWKFILSLADE